MQIKALKRKEEALSEEEPEVLQSFEGLSSFKVN